MKVAVIVGSTREGRTTDRMAKWVMNTLKDTEGTEATLLDLRDYDLPFFDDPISPKFNPDRKPTGVIKEWLDQLRSFDAYIIVTPEYNHSVTGVLKNALDYTAYEVHRKPFAVVSHGSAGGARAAAHLKNIISELRGMVVGNNVAFTHRVSENFDENGTISDEFKDPNQGPIASLQALIEDLQWYSDALSVARAKG